MTSPNFPTPFMSSAVASKGRARHKACGIAGKIDHHPTGRDTFGGRPDDDPLDTRSEQTICKLDILHVGAGHQASLHEEAVPQDSRRAGGLTQFWVVRRPRIRKAGLRFERDSKNVL